MSGINDGIDSHEGLRALIANDGHAVSFQTMGQYRGALLRNVDNLLRKLAAGRSTVRSWRDRMGKAADWPLHAPTDVERAMLAEIAELRMAIARAQQAAAPSAQLAIGVTAPQGATISIMQPHTDGTTTVIYGETHPAGDSMGRAVVAAKPGGPGTPEATKPTYMTDEQAERWAWEQVKLDVGTEGWTAGESCTYFGFFLWGWRYRAQYHRQHADQIDGGQREGV